jgi:hypothetical protein
MTTPARQPLAIASPIAASAPRAGDQLQPRRRPVRGSPARQGSTLVILLGLLSVLIGLMLAVTYRVRNGIVNGATFQHTVQAYIMLQSAKIMIQGRQGDGTLPGSAVTAGDELDLPNNGKLFANSMGWLHLKPAAGNNFDVIAAGGSGGAQGLKSGSGTINSGDPVANAMEARYHYVLTYNSANPPATMFTIQQCDVQDNSLYPW